MSDEILWTKAKWGASELHQKSVEFKLPLGELTISGIGQFFALQNQEDLVGIWLVTDQQGRHWAERIQTRYRLPQPAVDRIVVHPDPSIADFRLM